jgi:hypothetical protein
MTNTDKKQWSTPKLRIFVRTRAEEMVLQTCKQYALGNRYSSTKNFYCMSALTLILDVCGPCIGIAPS